MFVYISNGGKNPGHSLAEMHMAMMSQGHMTPDHMQGANQSSVSQNVNKVKEEEGRDE